MARTTWNETILGGVMLSIAIHAVPVGRSFMNLYEAREYLREARTQIHDYLWSSYDVEMEQEKPKEKPPEPEKVEEEKAPEAPPIVNTPPPPKAQPQEKKAPEPPPQAAAAGQVLTAKEDPNAPVDFGDTIVQGDAGAYAGGVTDSKGTSKDAVYDKRARGSEFDGGNGSGPAPTVAPAPAGPDLSKPASPASRDWNCSHLFPPEADEADVNQAVVSVIVTVRPDGSPGAVKVVADPGNGFGRAARTCALSQRYTAALDRDGKATTGSTPPFTVRFTR